MRRQQEQRQASAGVRLATAIIIMLPLIAHFVFAAIGFYVFFLADAKLQALLATVGQAVVGIPLYRRARRAGRWLDRILLGVAVAGYVLGAGLVLVGRVGYPVGAVHVALALSNVAVVWISSRELSASRVRP